MLSLINTEGNTTHGLPLLTEPLVYRAGRESAKKQENRRMYLASKAIFEYVQRLKLLMSHER